jgi:signal transduction histidine kinase
MTPSQIALENSDQVSLEAIISTAELAVRPTRPADHAAENKALIALARVMVTSPDEILQKLAETALTLCRAGSSGVSILESDGEHFHWPAIVGGWAKHVGGGTPREFGPCGTVLDRNAPQLMFRPERHFSYLASVSPGIEEVLLIPFYIEGRAVGTIWVIAHDSTHRFDAEDLRVMTNLATFAAAVYQMLERTARIESMQDLTELSGKVIQGQDDERRRIARELHDTTGQVLAALSMNLGQMRRDSSIVNAGRFAECLDLASAASTEIRNLSYLLHPPLMDESGLGSAIAEYAAGFERRSKLAVAVEITSNVGRLQGNREIALFRIMQECLGNIHRHSGSSTASIRVFREGQSVVLEVADQGRGLKRGEDGGLKYGVGLRSMQERLRPFGGSLSLESSDAGTKVTVTLPHAPGVIPAE